MGGWSSEREISLRSGLNVFQSLKRQGFNCLAIDIRKNFARQIERAKIDIAFIILHGKPGEDGTIQGFLELMGIPYTGSGVAASAVGMDKIISKRLFEAARIPTPQYAPIFTDSDINSCIDQAGKNFGYPMILKPRSEGSSVGIKLIRHPKNLSREVKKARGKFGDLFLEQFIEGMIATVGIVGKKVLPILELVPKKQEFYDYKAKYTKGETEFIIPARLPKATYQKVQALAFEAHQIIGGKGFSRVDLVADKRNHPFFLEVNTLPGMTELSDLPAQAAAIGMSYDELVQEILLSSLK